VDETRWVSSLPFGENGTPKLGAIVAHADPSQPEAARVLDAHLEASPLVRGVRYKAAHSPDRGIMDYAKRPNTLSERAFLRGFAAVAERGLSFELWLYGRIAQRRRQTLRPRHAGAGSRPKAARGVS